MDEKKPDVKEEVTLEELKEQVAALKAENENLKKDSEKLKAAQSNASADASEWKKKYHSTLDEASRKEAERLEAEQAMREELNALRAEKRISAYTAKLLEVGYDAQTATSMAMSLPEGISDDFFAQQKSFIESQKQIAKTETINGQPKLSVGEPPSVQKEDPEMKRWFGL